MKRGGPRNTGSNWRRRRDTPAMEFGNASHRASLKGIAAKADDIAYEILGGRGCLTNVSTLGMSTPDGFEPVTLQALLEGAEAARGLKPKDSWRVCAMFAPDQITVATTESEILYFCHPRLFPQVAAKYFEQQTPEQRANPLLGLNAIDLDPVRGDTAGQAAWRARERRRCFEIFARVMVSSLKGHQGGEDGGEG